MKRLIVSFFSLACAGTLNAAHCIWTGGADPADGKWSTKENWQDEAVPQDGDSLTLSGVGLVDGEITNDIANLSLTGVKFAGSTPFRLVGEKLTITKYCGPTGWGGALWKEANVSVTNACDIYCVNAEKRFYMTNRKDGGKFVLAGSFSGDVRLEPEGRSWVISGANEHTRGMRPCSASIFLENGNAVGVDGSLFEFDGASTLYLAPGDYHASFSGFWYNLKFTKNGDYNIYGSVTNTMNGDNFFLSDGSGVSTKYLTGMKIMIHGEFYAPKGWLYPTMHRNNQIHFLGKVSLGKVRGGYDNSECGVQCYYHATNALPVLSPGRQNRVFCAAKEVFPGSSLILNCSTTGDGESSPETGVMALQGYDQTLVAIDNDGNFTGEAAKRGLVTTPTGKPATLRLEPTANACTTAFLQGPLSLTLAAPEASTVQTFTNRLHTTTGKITVERGVLRFGGATTLASVPAITVKAGGTFEVSSTKATALAGLLNLTVEDGGAFVSENNVPFTDNFLDMTLGPSASVTLPAGACTLNSLVIDGGVMEPKTYTGAEIPANFKGVTSLTVISYPRATWTGAAGDHLWSTAENWEGERLPQMGWGVVLSNSGDDFEIENDMGAITLSSLIFQGSKPLRFSGDAITLLTAGSTVLDSASAVITNAVAMNFPAGSSTVTVSGGKAYYITGGLCGAGASVTLVQSGSGSTYYLGGTGSVDAVTMSSALNLISDTFLGEGATLTTSVGGITFYAGGDFRFNYKFTGTSGSTISVKVPKKSYNWRGSFDCSKMAAGNFLYPYNCRLTGQPYTDGVTLNFYGPVDLGQGAIHALFRGGIHFYQPLTSSHVYGKDWGWDAIGPIYFHATNNVAKISPAYSLYIVMRAPDALPNTILAFTCPTQNGSWLDLDGYDQTIDRITADASRLKESNNKYVFSGTSGYSRQGKKASLPAKLTLKATASDVAAVDIHDAITLVLDATDKSFTQAFTNKTCATTGDLIIKKGVFKIARGNSFAGVKNVTIGKEGKLVIDTNIASALKSVTNITVLAGGALEVADGTSMPITSGTPSLTLETGASVTIPSSATYTFKWAEKDGVSLEKNVVYTSANLPELTSGTIMTLKRKPHSTGLMLLIK